MGRGFLHKIMSFNLHVKVSSRQIEDEFPLWQTPTVLTNEVLNCKTNEEKVKKYASWANKTTDSQSVKEHISSFRKWIKNCDEKGYQVEFFGE